VRRAAEVAGSVSPPASWIAPRPTASNLLPVVVVLPVLLTLQDRRALSSNATICIPVYVYFVICIMKLKTKARDATSKFEDID